MRKVISFSNVKKNNVKLANSASIERSFLFKYTKFAIFCKKLKK